MKIYPKKFIETVDWSYQKSLEFYESNSRESVPNPYYIGFGNPNSKILVIGQELAFDSNDLEKLKRESIENPSQWKRKITGKFKKEQEGFDPEMPYGDFISDKNKRGNTTWSVYEKLNNLIGKNFRVVEDGNFKYNFFFTDLNSIPSRYSKGLSEKTKKDRMQFLKTNGFFQHFKIVILALGRYLDRNDIIEIFKVSSKEEKSKLEGKGKKLITYFDESNKKLIIHTRQLSGSVSGELLKQIGHEIENNIKL